MLPRNYRFVVVNNVGVAFTGATCRLRPWKFDTSGNMVFGAEITVSGMPTTLANQVAGAATAIDNSTDLFLGFDLVWSITVGTSQTGVASLFLQASTDGGTTWPSISTVPNPDEVEGELISTIRLSAETSRTGYASY